jgi:transcriptional regulator with XRE-family HTH domain
MLDTDNILEYKNKILSRERKKQKISQEAAAVLITLTVDQIKSLENNLDYGFITPHFKNLALKRYAKFLGIQLSDIINSDDLDSDDLHSDDLDNDEVQVEQNDVKDIVGLKLTFLPNLRITNNNISIYLVLIIGLFLFFILVLNTDFNDEAFSSKITTSDIKISNEAITKNIALPPVTKDFSREEELKVIPKQDNINTSNDLISTDSIEFLCTIKSASMDKIWSRAYPEKPATYFHIVSLKSQSICTIDNQGVLKQYDLVEGGKLTHRGEAPFKVQLDSSISELYFQGWKVLLNDNDNFIQLNPTDIVTKLN